MKNLFGLSWPSLGPPGHPWGVFKGSWARLGGVLEPLGAVLGDLKSDKMQTVQCENHFFENCLFRFLELLLALLGSSWRLLGRSWTQTGPKSAPKTAPKTCQKTESIFSSFLTNFGARLGPQNPFLRETHF